MGQWFIGKKVGKVIIFLRKRKEFRERKKWKKRLRPVKRKDNNTKVFIEGAYAVILDENTKNAPVILYFEGVR